MLDFTKMSKSALQKFGAEQFKSITGVHCSNYRVSLLECSSSQFLFAVGDLYFLVKQDKNGMIYRYIADEKYLNVIAL